MVGKIVQRIASTYISLRNSTMAVFNLTLAFVLNE